jgi:peptidoglycan/xylan/chitin deacetylase (PgdA/CDA1 family)
MRRTVVFLFVFFCLSGAAVRAQRGAYTASADLDQLVQQSQTILRGHVISAKVEPHPQLQNLDTVVVTLKIDRALKGSAGSTYTFRQYIWDARDIADSAGYRKAQELLLFLNPVSLYGLTSPVGLEQGRFRILRDAKGNRLAVNGHSNAGLFNRVASKANSRGIALSVGVQDMLLKASGPAPLDVLEEAIQSLAGVGK